MPFNENNPNVWTTCDCNERCKSDVQRSDTSHIKIPSFFQNDVPFFGTKEGVSQTFISLASFSQECLMNGTNVQGRKFFTCFPHHNIWSTLQQIEDSRRVWSPRPRNTPASSQVQRLFRQERRPSETQSSSNRTDGAAINPTTNMNDAFTAAQDLFHLDRVY